MTIRVFRPGLLTTVQDLGRFGLQHLGIVPCGAMDPHALRLANALVGNEPGAAALEITLRGPDLVFEEDTLIALCGAFHAAYAIAREGEQLPLPSNRPVLVGAGRRIVIGDATHGARSYLAVAGGMDVAPVLGSRATYLPASFGGLDGRAIQAGDRLPTVPGCAQLSRARYEQFSGRDDVARAGGPIASVRWAVRVRTLPEVISTTVRVLEGRHWVHFDAASRKGFENEAFRISPDSNRMGYRLLGPTLVRRRKREVLSEPTCLGTIQVPSDGAPILLMADHQTTGGYAKIAEVASAEVPRLAQLVPGASVRFVRCSLEEAAALREAAHAELAAIEQAIRWKRRM